MCWKLDRFNKGLTIRMLLDTNLNTYQDKSNLLKRFLQTQINSAILNSKIYLLESVINQSLAWLGLYVTQISKFLLKSIRTRQKLSLTQNIRNLISVLNIM